VSHLGSKKRQLARDKRAQKSTGSRPRLPDAVRAAASLSGGVYCTVHGTTHSAQAATEMGCFTS